MKRIAIIHLVFVGLIVAFASMSASMSAWAIVDSIPNGDKIGHLILIGSLGLFLNLGLSGKSRSWPTFLLPTRVSILLMVVFTIEEYLQRFHPVRACTLGDLACNYLGIFLFDRIAFLVQSRRNFLATPGESVGFALATDQG